MTHDPAMIVLKRTPNGFKLLAVTTIVGTRAHRMERSHPQAARTQYVMDRIMQSMRPLVNRGLRPTIGEAWAQVVALHGAEQFADVKLLISSGATPARLLIGARQ